MRKPKNHYKEWSGLDISTLKSAMIAGHDCEWMSKHFGRSKEACYAACRKIEETLALTKPSSLEAPKTQTDYVGRVVEKKCAYKFCPHCGVEL